MHSFSYKTENSWEALVVLAFVRGRLSFRETKVTEKNPVNKGLVALPLNVQLFPCQISPQAVPIGRHRNPHLLPVLNSAVKNGDVVGNVDVTLGKKHGLMVALVNI